MAEPARLNGEERNLIEGSLVGSSNGATFENVNPATEEVIGVCADGTKEDMESAIAAARRAFDETSWATDHAFRQKCLSQLCEALVRAREELRAVVIAEAGSPILLTYAVQCDTYIDAMPYWADLAGSYVYEREMSEITFMGQRQRRVMRREPVGVVGAITPWNFPAVPESVQDRPRPGGGQHRRAQAGSRHALVCNEPGPPDRRGDRHSPGCRGTSSLLPITCWERPWRPTRASIS